jgi:hypothetical protein
VVRHTYGDDRRDRTNEAGANLAFGFTVGNEVNNIGALVNSGTVGIAGTLNLTGGGPGITDVVAGSTLFQSGTLNVINDGVATNGLANLQSVAGFLALRNSQTTSVTPGTGTLVNSGTLLVTCASTLSVNGNVDNTGIFETSVGLDLTGFVNVSGTFVNASGAVLNVQGGVGALVPDQVTAGRLTNAGAVTLGLGLETVGGLLQVGPAHRTSPGATTSSPTGNWMSCWAAHRASGRSMSQPARFHSMAFWTTCWKTASRRQWDRASNF